MLRIPFEYLKFAFESFKSISNYSNLHSNVSNRFRMVLIFFECFESFSKALNLHLNPSNLLRIIRISFGCFESLSKGSNFPQMLRIDFDRFELHSNVSNPFRRVRICIKILENPFQLFEFTLE